MIRFIGNIKKMKLYRHPGRIYDDLKAAGYEDGAPLKVQDLIPFDQYHYLGTEAVDSAIELLGINEKKHVIEIGSGIGGPARYIAAKTQCHVTAIEMQPDLNDIAEALTVRCALSKLVRHISADILEFDGSAGTFDAIVSWLAFLHISDRKALFEKCRGLLKSGGKIFIEDFCRKSALNREDEAILFEDTACSYLPAIGEYKKHLAQAGFYSIRVTDMSKKWASFVRGRQEKFNLNMSRYADIHGKEVADEMGDFYNKMACIFTRGNVGGVRIFAQREGGEK
ncbi:MAG: methyltransferase domain-containing protein [Candidatus Omnitrophica bacterium]|nr:methyltransferase domain-containing protein [Candidatus Omnitrophota bacterium]